MIKWLIKDLKDKNMLVIKNLESNGDVLGVKPVKPDMPAIGYRTPRAVRDLHPSGYNDVLVHNMAELEDLNPATDAARISASIGKRKKDLMLEKASELGIKVLNK